MHSKTIHAAAAILFMLTGYSSASAVENTEGLALPAACASIAAASLLSHVSPDVGFEATRFRVRLPSNGRSATPGLEADRLRVISHAAGTSNAALEQAASASAAALLIALTGNGHSDCPAELLQRTGTPIVAGLQHGGNYLATWQGLTLRGGAGHVVATRMQLRLEAAGAAGEDRLVHMTLTLDGITGTLTPPTLLPDHILLRVTLPAASLPTLLAATAGGAPDAQIPVTVDDISLRSGRMVLHGHGDAIATATPMDSTAHLHLSALNFDDLVNRAALQDLVRMHTALFLSRLVSRQEADAIAWDVSFSDGLLAVNNVPIPLR